MPGQDGTGVAASESAKYLLNGVASLVEAAADAVFQRRSWHWVGCGGNTLPLDEVPDAVGVAGAIGVADADGLQAIQERLHCPTVGRLATCHGEGERVALRAAIAWISVLRPPRLIPIARAYASSPPVSRT